MKIYVQSFGGAKVVTGSMHLLNVENEKILIDAGMFQGINEYKNYDPLGFNPKEINALIITHAHLDHIGRIPLLYKYGFNGKVYATKATFDLLKIILLDSAKLQEEDYKTRYKKAQRRGKEKFVRPPLYTQQEVKKIFKKMKKIKMTYNKPTKISNNITITFKNAGHILGSAFIEIETKNKKIVFSGDLGNKNNDILPPPSNPSFADALFIESTYGDRLHKDWEESKKEFKKVVLETLLSGGNVIIPTFVVERAQQLLCLLKEMNEEGTLPKKAKVFLDSPMAKKITTIYKKYHHFLSEHCKKYKTHPFEFPQLKFTKTSNDSKKINLIEKGSIIIAGSGMCNGGRILHHLKHRIWNPKNSIIFVGYQAKGTIGRKIIDGAKFIKIFHEEIIVRAKIHTINGFSAHADQKELIEWIKSFKKVDKIFLIHGEFDKQIIFKSAIKNALGKNAHIVEEREKIYL